MRIDKTLDEISSSFEEVCQYILDLEGEIDTLKNEAIERENTIEALEDELDQYKKNES